MRTSLSLRMLIAISMFATGSIMIVVFSILSAKYFIDGLDVSMRESMKSISKLAAPSPGKPVQLNEFTIASRWQDLPSDLRFHLTPLRSSNKKFLQKIIQPTYLRPPETAYFAMSLEENGEPRFVSVVLTSSVNVMPQSSLNYFQMIFYTCIGGIIVFVLILLLLLYRAAVPLRDLVFWAQSLNNNNIQEPVPDFGFSDLNNMAQIIHNSVSSVEDGLQRERQFLSYASHELRTPISVTKSNVALMKKLLEKENSVGKQMAIANRLERAANTMSQLTETLLWLNRDEKLITPSSLIQLGDLIRDICEELQYLADPKNIRLTLETTTEVVVLPETLCRIVLTNLIRNAFQHTQDGSVVISQRKGLVTITNINNLSMDYQGSLGFGLGLVLTEKLVSRVNWDYDTEELGNGRRVTLDLKCTRSYLS